MGLLQPDQAEDPELSTDQEADLAARELGAPDAVFRAGGRRTKLKVALGAALVFYGLIANYLWWVHGPAKFGHLEFHFLILPPIIGGGLLGFLYRNRGLRILVFPTGLLRLTPNVVESFPWDAVTTLRLKSDAAEPNYERNDAGELTGCWFSMTVPLVQVWNSWFEIERADGAKTRFTPAVAEYPELARLVQCSTFETIWPRLLENLEQGGTFAFGELVVSRDGLRVGLKSLSWSDIKDVALAHRIIQIKRVGSWRAWWTRVISDVPNPHVLFGLFAMMGVKKPDEKSKPDVRPDP
jgi:hypothetical protein